MKVTPLVVLFVWTVCIVLSVTLTKLWLWQTLYLHPVTFVILMAPLIILHAKGQNRVIERLKSDHPERWKEFSANRSYPGLGKFYRNDEDYGDKKLRLLKKNYQRIFLLSIILMGVSIAASMGFVVSKQNSANQASHTMSANARLFHNAPMKINLNRLGISTGAAIVWI